MDSVLLQIGIIYFLGHFLSFIFKKYKVPDVLIFMILGLTIGPILNIVQLEEFGKAGAVLSTMALMVILFQSGVTLNLTSLAKVSLKGTVLTLVTFLFTTVLVILLSYPFTNSWILSAVTGIILSGTSSAVVIPMSQALRLSDNAQNILLLESSITDVLCIILTMTISMSLVSGKIDLGQIASNISMSFLIAVLIGLIAGAVWSHYKSRFQPLSTIAFALVLYGFVSLQGFSGAIAVMAMGFAITNTKRFFPQIESQNLTDAETTFYTELSFVLKTFFFIYLGVSLKLKSFSMLGVAALLTIAILVIRHFFNKIYFKNEYSQTEINYMTLMIPKGLAAAVLADVPVMAGLEGADVIPPFVYSVVFVSILLVSILVPFANRKDKLESNSEIV